LDEILDTFNAWAYCGSLPSVFDSSPHTSTQTKGALSRPTVLEVLLLTPLLRELAGLKGFRLEEATSTARAVSITSAPILHIERGKGRIGSTVTNSKKPPI